MLKQLVVSVISKCESLEDESGQVDIDLVRAAHQALVRQQKGERDCFLFVLLGELTVDEATAAIAPYGFPDVSVTCVNPQEDGGDRDDEDVREEIASAVAEWVEKNHPTSIPSVASSTYPTVDVWWTGIEASDDEWEFTEAYAATLPHSHRKRAVTWLTVLKDALQLDYPGDWLDENTFTIHAAALCEWLHGFEAVSGNGYNDFEAGEVGAALGIDDFFVGFQLSQLESPSSLRDLFEECECDPVDLRAYAIKQATSEERSTLRNDLSQFFGGDTSLYFTLRSSIWPRYTHRLTDQCDELVTPGSWEELGEALQDWDFVTNGWSEYADP